MSQLRIAVVGGGHLGRIHTRLLNANPVFDLVAVADTSPVSREKIADEFHVETVDDYRELLNRIDAAVIATPTASHYKIGIDLLTRGIHTLIEKPVTNTTPQADHLIQLSDRTNAVLQVGHVERFNPVFEKAAASLPNPRYIEAQRMSGYTFRSIDVGVVMDLMIHDIDLIVSLVSSPLVETRAVGVSVFGPHEDIAQARLEFANGTVANLTASRCSFKPVRSISWFSEHGYVSADLSSGEFQRVQLSDMVDTSVTRDVFNLDARQEETIKTKLFETVLPKTCTTVAPQNAIECEHNDFANAIRGNRVPRVTGRHGRRAVSIAQSIVESIEQHRWQDGPTQRTGAQGQPINLLPLPDSPESGHRAA